MPVDAIFDLGLSAGDPVVTRHFGASQSWVTFRLPQKESDSKWDRHFRAVAKEGSEIFLRLAGALEDGRISLIDAMNFLTEVDEAMSAFAALRNSLVARVDLPEERSTAR